MSKGDPRMGLAHLNYQKNGSYHSFASPLMHQLRFPPVNSFGNHILTPPSSPASNYKRHRFQTPTSPYVGSHITSSAINSSSYQISPTNLHPFHKGSADGLLGAPPQHLRLSLNASKEVNCNDINENVVLPPDFQIAIPTDGVRKEYHAASQEARNEIINFVWNRYSYNYAPILRKLNIHESQLDSPSCKFPIVHRGLKRKRDSFADHFDQHGVDKWHVEPVILGSYVNAVHMLKQKEVACVKRQRLG